MVGATRPDLTVILDLPPSVGLSRAAGRELLEPNVDHTAQKCSRAHNHGQCLIYLAHLRHYTADTAIFHQQALDQGLLDVQPRLPFQHRLHL